MALTLQSGLELAGGLPKVQPQLQRLHIVEKPKRRHVLRNVVFVGSTIAALLQKLRIVDKPKRRHLLRNAVFVGSTIAAGVFVAVFVCRRQGWCNGAVAGDEGDAQAIFPGQEPSDVAPDREGQATDGNEPRDIDAPRAA